MLQGGAIKHADDEPLAVSHPDIMDVPEDPRITPMAVAYVKVGAAPPSLAPAVPGKLESHGKHIYHAYNGRWKDGHMRGAIGVYIFADGGKYTGAWKDSAPNGPGTAVCKTYERQLILLQTSS